MYNNIQCGNTLANRNNDYVTHWLYRERLRVHCTSVHIINTQCTLYINASLMQSYECIAVLFNIRSVTTVHLTLHTLVAHTRVLCRTEDNMFYSNWIGMSIEEKTQLAYCVMPMPLP